MNLPTVVTPVTPLEDLGPVQKILKGLHTRYKSLALNNLTVLFFFQICPELSPPYALTTFLPLNHLLPESLDLSLQMGL